MLISMNAQRKTLNVLGTKLELCCLNPQTGYYRDGYCNTDESDLGSHTVCAIMDESFLNYTKAMGNDLSTPRLEYNFPGLKAGDKWCLCALRWQEAFLDGKAPQVIMEATHQAALKYIKLKDLKNHAFVTESN
jgi:uncharacterized protein (DUF2237 family)